MKHAITDKETHECINSSPFASPIAIIVLGASGDLAKRKTYPCLFQLNKQRILVPSTSSTTGVIIYGFGRTSLSNEEFRESIRPFLSSHNVESFNHDKSLAEYEKKDTHHVSTFLSMCFYQVGRGYDDINAFGSMRDSILKVKQEKNLNLLFYMATPPNIFAMATKSITQVFQPCSGGRRRSKDRNFRSSGFLRVLYEKPFGSDLHSYEELSDSLLNLLDERQIFRIDHYLGKDMVRRIPHFRFGDSPLKMIMNKTPHFWSRRYISKVVISLKELIGTDGRGGYFDQYGIIRDVVQNHLLQVMCLVAMEQPNKQDDMDVFRDAKCELLRHVHPPIMEDCIVGQYTGYRREPMVKKNSKTPTFVVIRLFVDNDRWRGVPFILLAGKGLDEKSVDVDIIFRENILSDRGQSKNFLQEKQKQPQQHLVALEQKLTIRIQPQQYVCFRTHTNHEKSMPVGEKHHARRQSAMIWNFEKYNRRDQNHSVAREQKVFQHDDDSYSKLVHDALQGRSSSFVRDDELRLSWSIFTPLLHQLENVEPYPYEFGSKGPSQAHKMIDLDGSQDGRRSKL
jgi:glucose-6-phosphate 1-dehydrogenase